MVFLGFFLLPRLVAFEPWEKRLSNDFFLYLPFYLLLLPNVITSFLGHIPFVSLFWSIGVEEQFYLIWPLLLKKFKKSPFGVFISVILLFTAARGVFGFFTSFMRPHEVNGYYMRSTLSLLHSLQFECMAIGGIGAWLVLNNNKALQYVYRKDVQVISILSIILLMYNDFNLLPFENIVYGIPFAIIIVNVATNPDAIIKLRGKLPDFLGRISYGLYVYHTTVIIILLSLKHTMAINIVLFNIMLYFGTLIITIALSVVSFYCFERKILRYKDKYSVIKSNNTSPVTLF